MSRQEIATRLLAALLHNKEAITKDEARDMVRSSVQLADWLLDELAKAPAARAEG